MPTGKSKNRDSTSKAFEVDIKSLKVATFNVNGLNNVTKQNSILNSLKKSNFDVIALQETHLLETDYYNINQAWEGKVLYAEGTRKSKGLCILFSKKIAEENIETIFTSDRFLLCAIKIGNEIFYFGNAYAPNNNIEKLAFFEQLSKNIRNKIEDHQRNRLFLMGDFNCVLDNEKDIISGFPHSKDTVSKLNSFLENNDLVDLWRKDNPDNNDFTWSRGTPLVARRIDFIFAN